MSKGRQRTPEPTPWSYFAMLVSGVVSLVALGLAVLCAVDREWAYVAFLLCLMGLPNGLLACGIYLGLKDVPGLVVFYMLVLASAIMWVFTVGVCVPAAIPDLAHLYGVTASRLVCGSGLMYLASLSLPGHAPSEDAKCWQNSLASVLNQISAVTFAVGVGWWLMERAVVLLSTA